MTKSPENLRTALNELFSNVYGKELTTKIHWMFCKNTYFDSCRDVVLGRFMETRRGPYTKYMYAVGKDLPMQLENNLHKLNSFETKFGITKTKMYPVEDTSYNDWCVKLYVPNQWQEKFMTFSLWTFLIRNLQIFRNKNLEIYDSNLAYINDLGWVPIRSVQDALKRISKEGLENIINNDEWHEVYCDQEHGFLRVATDEELFKEAK